MSYEVRFEGAALFQLDGIPDDAFDALVERVSVLADEQFSVPTVTTGMTLLLCVRAGRAFSPSPPDGSAKPVTSQLIAVKCGSTRRVPPERTQAALSGRRWHETASAAEQTGE